MRKEYMLLGRRATCLCILTACVALAGFGGCPRTQQPVETTPAVGDLNEDGVIDAADLEILTSVFGTRAGDPRFIAAADLNGDGVIGLADTQALISLIQQASVAE